MRVTIFAPLAPPASVVAPPLPMRGGGAHVFPCVLRGSIFSIGPPQGNSGPGDVPGLPEEVQGDRWEAWRSPSRVASDAGKRHVDSLLAWSTPAAQSSSRCRSSVALPPLGRLRSSAPSLSSLLRANMRRAAPYESSLNLRTVRRPPFDERWMRLVFRAADEARWRHRPKVAARIVAEINYTEVLSDLVPKLDGWRQRTESSFEVAENSPLWCDDQVWPTWPLTSCAHSTLASAVDHMQAIRVLIEADSLHPMATFSLSRSALLASSTAIWLLAEREAKQRQARGLIWVREVLEKQRDWHSTAAKTQEVYWGRLATVACFNLMRRRGIEWAFVREDLPRASRMPNSTRIVTYAAERAFQGGTAQMAQYIVAHWQSASSDAHGLPWGALQRGADGRREPSGSVLHEFQMGGDLGVTVRHLHEAAVMTSWAWRRLDELNEPGRDPNSRTRVRTKLRQV